MKKILSLFAICMICSCASTDAEKKALQEKLDSIEHNRVLSCVEEVEIKGHIYLIYDGCREGNIIHAEHCPCKVSKSSINN